MFDAILHHRVLVLACTLLLLLICASGISKIEITSDNRSFFNENEGRFADLLEFERRFTPYSTASILITSEEPIEISDPHISAHAWLTRNGRLLPNVARVDSLATFPTTTSKNDELHVTTIIPEDCVGSGCRVYTTGLSKEVLLNRFLSYDRKTSAILIYFRLEVGQSRQVSKVVDAIESTIRRPFAESFPTLQLHVTGGVPMMQAFATAAEKDTRSLLPLTAAVLFVALRLVVGSTFLAVAMVLLGAASSTVALGIGGWTSLVLNSATTSIPIVIFALMLASTMHLFLHIGRDRSIHGSDTLPDALRSALAVHTVPIVMTIGTTIVGMLSLVGVPSPPVRELGIWVSVGLSAGLLLTFTSLPALLSYRERLTKSRFAIGLQSIFNRYARAIEQGHPNLIPTVAIVVACVAGISQLEINDDFVEYFQSDSLFKSDTDFATTRLAGPYGLELVLTTSDKADVFQPEYFDYLHQLVANLRSQRNVRNVVSIYELLEDVAKEIDPTGGRLEHQTAEYLAQLFLTYNFSLQIDQSTSDFVDFERTSSRVSVVLDKSTSADIRNFAEKLESWHDDNAPEGLNLTITGESVPTAYLSPSNIEAMIGGIVLSLIFSAGMIGLYYRDFRICMIALVAILTPALIGFGLWGWIYNSIGLATTVVVAITIGVVIDDSIHLIVRAKDGEASLGLTGVESAAYSIYRVGIAVVGTTVVLVLGFAMLLFSNFELNSAFGLCTILILVSAMAFDLLMLPRLIAWAIRSTEQP